MAFNHPKSPTLSTSQGTICGGGWTHQLGETCYAYIHEVESWPNAQSVCRALGGYLAEILSQQVTECV